MADIDSNLPIRTLNDGAGGAADVTVGLLNSSDYRIDPLDIAGYTAGVAGITGAIVTQTAGLTAAIESQTAGLTAQMESDLAGITGALETQTAGLTAQMVTDTAGITGAIETSTAGITGALETQTAGLTAQMVSDTAGITGAIQDVSDQLPAALGQTAVAGSLSVTIASGQPSIPVYIAAGSSTTNFIGFTTGVDVASLAGITGTYSPTYDFVLNNVHAAGSGRIKVEVYVGPVAAPLLKWVAFNSTANPNVFIDCSETKLAGGTDKVQVVVYNYEPGKTQDLYATIVGDENLA